MASDFAADEEPGTDGPLTPEQARAALAELHDDGSRLAAQVVTPWWYHPLLGLIAASLVASSIFQGFYQAILVFSGIIAITVLRRVYTDRYGVWPRIALGRRARGVLFILVGTLALCFTAVLAIKLTGAPPWWAGIPALVSFVTTLIGGRRYDEALRQEIAADPTRPRS